MDFRLSDDAEAFRGEVRAFLAEAMTDARAHSDPLDLAGLAEPFERAMHAAAGRRGLLSLAPERRFVFECEVARADAPLVDTAVTLAGHAVMSFASPAMRDQLLAEMSAGTVEMCIAYTEENAGTDLTGMQTRAEPVGDDHGSEGWVLTGKKVLVTGAHKSDWCVTVARTTPDGPPRKSFTMFLVDMRLPGVRVVRRPTMNGWTIDDIEFDAVPLGPDAVMGTVGSGWSHMSSAVAAERTGTFWLGFAHRSFALLVEHVRGARRDGVPLRDDPIARDVVARCAVELADAERLCRRAFWAATTPGEADAALPSMVKIVLTELLQRLAQASSELAGEAGLVWSPAFGSPHTGERPPGAAAGGRFAWEYLERVHGAISVGPNELHRDVLATVGLGLPRRGS